MTIRNFGQSSINDLYVDDTVNKRIVKRSISETDALEHMNIHILEHINIWIYEHILF
jgi:hypothetical protein